jgi:ParB/RepB/Spo0J family partition protein
MQNVIETIPLEKLRPNPANPNRMSKANLARLVTHIERTGRYEPLIVRPCPQKKNRYEIINGHHRCQALKKLGHSSAQCVIWNVDGPETDLLLATLNRLAGRDDLHKRSRLISKLAGRLDSLDSARDRTKQLSRLLPESKRQIERLMELALKKQPVLKPAGQAGQLATAVVFFLTNEQKSFLEEALAGAAKDSSKQLPAAKKKATALLEIVKVFMTQTKKMEDNG